MAPMHLRRPFLALLAATVLAATASGDEFSIEDYRFTWTAAEVDDSALAIMVTQDEALAIIYDGSEAIRLTVPEVAAIGKLLERTRRWYLAHRNDREATREPHEIGNWTVSFHQHPEHGFGVVILARELNADGDLDGVQLNREAAIKLAKPFQQAPKMAAFLRERVGRVVAATGVGGTPAATDFDGE